MAVKFTNRLGLEFYENEIRVVEVKVRGSEVTVGGYGAVPIEPGYLQDGVITSPELIGGRIRAFLDQHGIATQDTVASFPTVSCAVRVLNLPKVADHELRTIIDGEVSHYGLARNGGAYDFISLDRSSREDTGTPVLLMAADGYVTESVSQTLSSAGLRLIALEPTHCGLLRSAYLFTQNHEQAIFLTLSEQKADMCLFGNGSLMFYRSFDIGTAQLQAIEPATTMFPSDEEGLPTTRGLNEDAASSIMVEMRRSIAYFQREYPDLEQVQRIVLAANSDQAARFGQWLQTTMGVVVESVVVDPTHLRATTSLSPTELARYLAAYGLAMRDTPAITRAFPQLDLAKQEQIVAEMAITGRNARIGAYVLAFVAVLAALGATAKTIQVNKARAILDQSAKDVERAHQAESLRQDQDRKTVARLSLLRKQGLPVNSIALAISRSLPPNTGISEMRIETGRADLTGEATKEESITSLIRALQLNPLVQGVSLTNYEVSEQNSTKNGVRFNMLVTLATDIQPSTSSTPQNSPPPSKAGGSGQVVPQPNSGSDIPATQGGIAY